jgi:hypothetical protein
LAGTVIATDRVDAVGIGPARCVTRGALVHIDAGPRRSSVARLTTRVASIRIEAVFIGCTRARGSGGALVHIDAVTSCSSVARLTGTRVASIRIEAVFIGCTRARGGGGAFVDIDATTIWCIGLISRTAIATKASVSIDAITIWPAGIAGCAFVDVCASSRRIALVASVARTRVTRTLANGISTTRRYRILNTLAGRTVGTGIVYVAGCMLAK